MSLSRGVLGVNASLGLLMSTLALLRGAALALDLLDRRLRLKSVESSLFVIMIILVTYLNTNVL